jgi:adenylate cyclase
MRFRPRRDAVTLRERLRAFDTGDAGVSVARRLRRVLPGDPAFGDPLSTAGRDGAGTVARVADRVLDEQPRVSKELGLGALQLWQALAEKAGRGRGDVELTLVFTDLAGFSSWSLKAGDDLTLQLLREVAQALEPPLIAHRGRVVKRLGDGVMATFLDAQAAFDALVEARDRLSEVQVDGFRPRLRAALHTGRPKAIGDDYLGVDVNVAARLVERAGPDEVLVSDVALAGLDPERVVAKRKKSFVFSSPKGVPSDMIVYAVTPA